MKPRLTPLGAFWWHRESREFWGTCSGEGMTPERAYRRWQGDIPWWRRLQLWRNGRNNKA